MRHIPIQQTEASFLSSAETNESVFAGEGHLACDVFQDSDAIIVVAMVAGVDQKDLDITVASDVLTVRGFREAREAIDERDYFARECFWGSFSRSIVLPQEIDQSKVRATITNGVLKIILPKKYKTASIKIRRTNG